MEFNIDNAKLCTLVFGKTNIHSIYHMSNTVLGTTSGVFVSDDLKVSKHCALCLFQGK